MNPKYHLLVTAATLSLGACSTDDTVTEPATVTENGGHKIAFTIAEDSETRTTLAAGDILRWVPTDMVGIYTVGDNVNSNAKTVADVNQSPVEFIGNLENLVSNGDMFYAYYPYDKAQSKNPAKVTLTIPAAQTQSVVGEYNGQSQPLAAVPMAIKWEHDSYAGRISSARFRLLGAIVELQLFSSNEALRGENIQSVTFESDNPLAGDFTFDLKGVTETGDLPITGYESKTVTTTLAESADIPETKEEAARIYLTIAPGTYAGKFVVETDAARYTFTLTEAMEFKRAVIKGLPADLAGAKEVIKLDAPIPFADPEVKRICVENWDTSVEGEEGKGELSYREAAAVTSIGTRFKSNISIQSFDELQYFIGLQSIGETAFFGCSSLTNIHLPARVTTIEGQAFDYCASLTSITIPDKVTSIGERAFEYCVALKRINIPDGVTEIGNYAFASCGSLTSINIPGGVTAIGSYAFASCGSLTSINIPGGVTAIGSYAFSGCSALTSITVPVEVTEIGSCAFSGCSALTSITISSDNVTAIKESTFFGCSSLKSITIPNNVIEIEKSAFRDCSLLTSIQLSNELETIKSYAFKGCSNLESITIPYNVTTIGNEAFEGCSNLKSIQLSNELTTIESYAFSGCSSLGSITIPGKVTTIGQYCFRYCSSLESVYCKPTVPPFLGYYVFNDTPLTQIYVPTGSVEAYKTATDKGWNDDYASLIVADNSATGE